MAHRGGFCILVLRCKFIGLYVQLKLAARVAPERLNNLVSLPHIFTRLNLKVSFMNPRTQELLNKARQNKDKKTTIAPFSYVEMMTSTDRTVTVRAAARRAMRGNREALELLADL